MLAPAIEISHLFKTFGNMRRGGRKAVANATLRVMPGEMVALIGASGSGKSTLLRLIAGLVESDRRPGSRIAVHDMPLQQDGHIVAGIRARRREVGVIFQQFNLVDRLSVLTNVLVGMLARVPKRRTLTYCFAAGEKRAAIAALQRVGIADLALQRASTLSGGQQQRAAIARALVQRARVILADEPIASLDPESSRRVMDLLARINREDGTTILVSLHQVDFALSYCPRVVALRAGEVVFDGPSEAVTPSLLQEVYGSDFVPPLPLNSTHHAAPRAAGRRTGFPAAAGI